MTPFHLILPVIALVGAVPVQQGWQRYAQPTGLSAELPGTPERFDAWTSIAKGRVIQLTYTARSPSFDFQAYYFLQAVIADQPYDVNAKIAADIAEAKGGGDAAVAKDFVSQRALKPSEMPLPGMRGTELVYRYQSAFDDSGPQIEIARNMYVGNKWLSISVRHFEKDNRWPHDRFFNSLTWAP